MSKNVSIYYKSAVYECAEGGYYVEEVTLGKSKRFPSQSEAKRVFEQEVRDSIEQAELEGMQWYKFGNFADFYTGYVGEGFIIALETDRQVGERSKVYEGYC